MTLPLPTRYADSIRYAHESVSVLDWRAYPQTTTFLSYSDINSIVQKLTTSSSSFEGEAAAAYLAGYALALNAHANADRPSSVQRSALVQAAERLRNAQPNNQRLAAMLSQAITRADTAIDAGTSAEIAITETVSAQIARADRVADRCGRMAATLLDENDVVLTHGNAGPALIYMLHAALHSQSKAIKLWITAASDPAHIRSISALAHELGVETAQLPADLSRDNMQRTSISIFVAGATQIALDGAVGGETGLAAAVAFARKHGLPRYILGYDGPNPHIPTAAELPTALDHVPSELISAISTSRGLYRPEMIARYLADGDAPLDVIPLNLS